MRFLVDPAVLLPCRVAARLCRDYLAEHAERFGLVRSDLDNLESEILTLLCCCASAEYKATGKVRDVIGRSCLTAHPLLGCYFRDFRYIAIEKQSASIRLRSESQPRTMKV